MKFLYSILLVLFCGCKPIGNTGELYEMFSKTDTLNLIKEFRFEDDSLGRVEGIWCEGKNLIIYDVFEDYCYSKFDALTGHCLTRFGKIGEGPGEILLGGYGILKDKYLYVFNDQTKKIQKVSIDTINRRDTYFSDVLKYAIDGAQFSKLIPVNDSVFIGAGYYKLDKQFVLFDENSKVLDSAIDVYNKNFEINDYFKYLSNQGVFVKNPYSSNFAYSVNFSSNIDFFKIENDRIQHLKSLRFENPDYDFVDDNGTLFRAIPSRDANVGYINICSDSRYVYALFSNKKLYSNWCKSNIILIFDWDGNAIKKCILDKDAYYIAVSEELNKMFAVVKNESAGWSVVCYEL